MSGIRQLEKLREGVGDLLERHDTSHDLSRWAEYRDDPVGFMRDVLKCEPWSMQRVIAQSVVDHPLTVVQSCNAAGKDFVAARLAMWWSYCRGGMAIVTGPSERQVRRVVFGEIRRAFAGADLPGEMYELELRINREANTGIIGFTASSVSGLQGFHGENVLVIVTEGQGVENHVYEAMHGCAVGEHDRQLVVGNPLHPSGSMYQFTKRDSWNAIRIQATDHPNVIEDRIEIPGGVTRAFVDRMREEYGVSSPVYRSRVLGEWPEFAEQGLISRAWLERAAELYREGAFAEESAIEDPVIAIDPARYGADSTGVVVRRGQRITHTTRWGQVSLTETAERLIPVLDAEGIFPKMGDRPTRSFKAKGRILVDAHGLGSGLVDRLREHGYRTEEFLGMRRLAGGKHFNERAAAFWRLREMLENEQLALEWDPYLVEELLSVEWSTPTGSIQIVDKNQIKKLIGRSPDMADALSMVCYSNPKARARVIGFSPMGNYPGGQMFGPEIK